MDTLKALLADLKDLAPATKLLAAAGLLLITLAKADLAFCLLGVGLIFWGALVETWPGEGARGTAGAGSRKPSIRLMWTHQVQFVGFYEAVKQGAEIELREGGSPVDIDPIAAVLNGIDDFGVCTCVDLVRCWHTKAAFREQAVVPCMVIFRKSPACIIAARQQKISLDDLNGARVGFYGRADSTYREFSVLAAAAELRNLKSVFLEDERFLNPVEALTDAGINFRIGYSFNEGLVSDFQRRWSMEMLAAVFGETLYADVLFTRAQYLADHAAEAEKIIAMIWEGYRLHLRPDSEGETWSVLKQFCATQYDQLSKMMAKTGHSPLVDVRERLRESFDRDCDFAKTEAIGSNAVWENMERLTVFTTSAEESYVTFLHKQGLL